MMHLALLRHAEAVTEAVGGDHARPLTMNGRGAAAAVGPRLRDLLPPDALVIASDARRTRETAELAFPGLDPGWLRLELALYAALPEDLISIIRTLPDRHSVVLVGHNPGLSEAASLLAGEGEPAGLARLAGGLGTAEAAVFAFETGWVGVAPKAGRLIAMLTRTDLRS